MRGGERSRGADYPILLVEARRFDLNWRVKRGPMCHFPDGTVGQLYLNLVVSYADNCSFSSDTWRHLDFLFWIPLERDWASIQGSSESLLGERMFQRRTLKNSCDLPMA